MVIPSPSSGKYRQSGWQNVTQFPGTTEAIRLTIWWAVPNDHTKEVYQHYSFLGYLGNCIGLIWAPLFMLKAFIIGELSSDSYTFI